MKRYWLFLAAIGFLGVGRLLANDTAQLGGGLYQTTTPTYTAGHTAPAQADSHGNSYTNLGAALAGENVGANRMEVEVNATPFENNTISTTSVKGTAGWIGCLNINTKASSNNTIIVYDSSSTAAAFLLTLANSTGSGGILARIDGTVTAGPYCYNEATVNGLVIANQGANAADINVQWR